MLIIKIHLLIMSKVVFKEYNRNQATFLPPSLEELIDSTHMVRFVDQVIDQMDLNPILASYPGGGASSYHPRMMLKILIYGYVERINSCRDIAKAVRERIPFMWMAGGQRPDFRTINNFRNQRLPEGGIKGVFTQVVGMLVELGLVDLSEYTVDGTTLEANARRHSAVWRKNSERYKQSALVRIGDYFDQIQALADLEEAQWASQLAPEEAEEPAWTVEQISEAAQKAEQAIAHREVEIAEREGDTRQDSNEPAHRDGPSRKDLDMARTRLRWITETEIEKVAKYEAQLRTMGERNSYSSTDPDATFMRMKDQSPFDKLLAAGYNLQMGAQNQYVLGYSMHSNAADKVNLEEHLESLSFSPQWLCADAGYGSLYNYELLEEADITGVIKHPQSYHKPSPYSRYAMEYEPEADQYRCPQGRAMPLKEIKDYQYGPEKERTAKVHVYESSDCSGCPVKSECTHGQGNRSIQFIPDLEDWKQTMSKRMSQGKGKRLSHNRGMAIESVFGLLKHNDGMRRLLMRGIPMVEVEVGLKALAHNLRKMRTDILKLLMLHLIKAMSLQQTHQTR